MQQKIIILDFGSQTTQLIGRRVRELDTFCEILPYKKHIKTITTDNGHEFAAHELITKYLRALCLMAKGSD